MAKYLLTDAYVSIDSVELSDHAFSLDTPSEREQVDVSGFSSTGAREFLPGQREDTITIGFLQDFAAGEVHATLYPIYRDSEVVALVIRPVKASAVSAANPELRGNVALFSYNGLSGELNARGEMTAEFKAADVTGLTWEAS